jgi:hypothetical protein
MISQKTLDNWYESGQKAPPTKYDLLFWINEARLNWLKGAIKNPFPDGNARERLLQEINRLKI